MDEKRQEGSDRPWWNDDCTRIGCAQYRASTNLTWPSIKTFCIIKSWTLSRGSREKCLGFFTQRLQWCSIPAWHQNMWHTEPPYNEDKIMKTADVFFRPRWKWHSLKRRQVINRYDHCPVEKKFCYAKLIFSKFTAVDLKVKHHYPS